MPLTVCTREFRDALRREIVYDLAGVSEIPVALERGDDALARRLRCRYLSEMRLLDDVGWGAEDPGESFALTMPAAQLAQVLRRLMYVAVSRLLTGWSITEPHQILAMHVCSELLEALACGEQDSEPQP